MEKIKNIQVNRDLGVALREMTPELVESRSAEFVISSESVDAHGTVFRMDGWDLERYSKNPIVLYGHRSGSDNPDDIIGTSEVFVRDNELIGKVTFEDGDVNGKAEKIFRKVQNGTLRMASIGAKILDGHFGNRANDEDPDILYFTRQQLMEWSIVPIGSNPDALKRELDTIEEIRQEHIQSIETIEEENEQKQGSKVRDAQILIYKYNK